MGFAMTCRASSMRTVCIFAGASEAGSIFVRSKTPMPPRSSCACPCLPRSLRRESGASHRITRHSKKVGGAPPKLRPPAERSPMTFKIPIYKVKLVRDYMASYPTEFFDDPRPAADFFYRLIGSADREHTAALFLDEWKRTLSATIIGIGTLTSVAVRAREVFKAAVLASAHSLIFSHNHPLGSAEPSKNDILSTRYLMTAGACLGIRVRDHIIVSSDG